MSKLKHLGHDTSTKRKYVVVFREIPDDTNNCLVVESDTLTDRYHDGLMSSVESAEAQQSDELYEVLNRRMFFDGDNILVTLHNKRWLKKVSTDSVTMSPSPNETILLKDLNVLINSTKTEASNESLDDNKPSDFVPGESQESESDGQARNLIIQAQLLEEDARRKRNEAERLSPGINDQTKRPRGRPKKDAPVSPLINSNGETENEKV